MLRLFLILALSLASPMHASDDLDFLGAADHTDFPLQFEVLRTIPFAGKVVKEGDSIKRKMDKSSFVLEKGKYLITFSTEVQVNGVALTITNFIMRAVSVSGTVDQPSFTEVAYPPHRSRYMISFSKIIEISDEKATLSMTAFNQLGSTTLKKRSITITKLR